MYDKIIKVEEKYQQGNQKLKKYISNRLQVKNSMKQY